MCNLYRMTNSASEVARLFNDLPVELGNIGKEVYPGHPGLVMDGSQARSMTWGFPLVLKGKQGQPLKPKPVNNARTDKLKSFFWRDSFENRRCLIPVSAYAEAQGPKGAKTRTWISMPDDELFSVAGIWRKSDEWGPVYSMVMTEASQGLAKVHDRMPVVLHQDHYRDWLTASPAHAFDLCRPFEADLQISETDEPWVRKR